MNDDAPGLLRVARSAVRADVVAGKVGDYRAYHEAPAEQRQRDYATMVNAYFDLATDFYEFGWGQSFHFAPRARGETFRESILRYEQWLALRLGLTPDSQVLDVGCGVGGPMRTIARFAGCKITGLNNNGYQLKRAAIHTRRAGLEALCETVEGDFMAMPFPDAHFDAAYALEATVHAPSIAGVYAEIARVLKPGGMVACYEWAMTRRFVASDTEHQRIRREIEINNGVPCVSTAGEIADAVASTGLELVQVEDRCEGSEVPWWEKLAPAGNPFALRRSSGIGKHFTNGSVRVLEALRIAPRGTTAVARMLDQGGRALVAGGMAGIFTPSLLVVARKV
ncbi:MAG: sterol 24-C-methyltransferase [Acetobacteraceae bacterium]|jgi:sterol 24-C-methyltransferase|nr:cycloartenol-C-24-methyltransferase [Rhodopila sp.]MEA2731366.1 sterol 24-C-methyltransferase [Acetobacteraceae bacterium]